MTREAFPNLNNIFEQLFTEVDFIKFCIWLKGVGKQGRNKRGLLVTGPGGSGKTTLKEIVSEIFKGGFAELEPKDFFSDFTGHLLEQKLIVAVEEVKPTKKLIYCAKYVLTTISILVHERYKPKRFGYCKATLFLTSQTHFEIETDRWIHLQLKNQLIYSEYKHEIPAFIEYINNHY